MMHKVEVEVLGFLKYYLSAHVLKDTVPYDSVWEGKMIRQALCLECIGVGKHSECRNNSEGVKGSFH